MEKSKKEKIKDWLDNCFVFPNYLIVSPFKGFNEIKENKKGGFWQATFWLLVFSFIVVLKAQYTVFFLNKTNPSVFNGFKLFFITFIPLLVISLSNWAVSTIFSGSGKLKEIYQVLAFSLYPLVVTKLIYLILSHFVAETDITLLKTIDIIGYVMFIFLFFVGLVVVHEYGFFKNILMLLLTVFAFCIIFYIIFLIFLFLQQTTGFLYQFIEEIIFRIRL